MEQGFMYLFAIIDHYSRRVVGWSLSNTMTSEWCINCIRETIKTYGKPEIINSDQGCQFTSMVYVDAILSYGDISMDGKQRAIDNIFIKRFWRSLKYEHTYLHVYEDGATLWNGINGYMRFYNNVRLHQSLEYKTPKDVFDSAHMAA